MNFGAAGKILYDLGDSLMRRKQRSATREFLKGFRLDVRRAFQTSSDPATGAAWAPRVHPAPHKLLIKSGTMMAAELAAVDSAKPDGGGVTITLTKPHYAGAHHKGTGRLPMRRSFAPSPQTVAKARKWYADDLVKLVVGKK